VDWLTRIVGRWIFGLVIGLRVNPRWIFGLVSVQTDGEDRPASAIRTCPRTSSRPSPWPRFGE